LKPGHFFSHKKCGSNDKKHLKNSNCKSLLSVKSLLSLHQKIETEKLHEMNLNCAASPLVKGAARNQPLGGSRWYYPSSLNAEPALALGLGLAILRWHEHRTNGPGSGLFRIGVMT